MTNESNKKEEQLQQYKANSKDKPMTTNQGLKVSNDEFSLKAGVRGPTLMEDFQFREKMTHFDHERIPERVVHARGFGAHGVFELYKCMKKYTAAKFLHNAGSQTPVFVRFSTVVGSKGSADTARDVRGFATKFYTDEGIYDLVGNNMPVFFIQDAMKFPDVIHAVKPEPHNEIPQASSAHDTFWDFVANNQETAHMIMWVMSDRAIPRSFRMMEGFGVHTFRFVNEQGHAHFVKFHWKPALGVHSLIWDEAQTIAGKDADFNRRDLWESIERGQLPEYELGVQIIREDQEFMFDFDILDPTKLWPEEIVPVQIIGKMTLTKNVSNAFAEVEQVAFHPGNVVRGIDFTNDPLLQGRLFSYIDTQLLRLGGPNFTEIPINRPTSPVNNNQRDGFSRQRIDTNNIAYHQNSLAGNTPYTTPFKKGGFAHYAEKVEGRVVQARSESFADHFSQARLFWNSMTPVEKKHIINAFSFEVGKVNSKSVQQQVVDMFANVSTTLAKTVARNVGVKPPSKHAVNVQEKSPALSQEHTRSFAYSLRVGVIVGNGFQNEELDAVRRKLKGQGVIVKLISEKLGTVQSSTGEAYQIDAMFKTTDSALFDSLYIIGGDVKNDSYFTSNTEQFIEEAYNQYKPIGVARSGEALFFRSRAKEGPGVIFASQQSDFPKVYSKAIAKQRFWDRKVY